MNKYLLILYNNILLRILLKMNSNNTLKRTIKYEEDNSPKKKGRKPKSPICDKLPLILYECRMCKNILSTILNGLCNTCFNGADIKCIKNGYVYNIKEEITDETQLPLNMMPTEQDIKCIKEELSDEPQLSLNIIPVEQDIKYIKQKYDDIETWVKYSYSHDIHITDSFISETYDLLEPRDNMAYSTDGKTFFNSLIKNNMISVCMVDNKPTIRFCHSTMNKQCKEIIQQILFNRDSLCNIYNLSFTDEFEYAELKECFNDYLMEPLFSKYGLEEHKVQPFTFDIEPL